MENSRKQDLKKVSALNTELGFRYMQEREYDLANKNSSQRLGCKEIGKEITVFQFELDKKGKLNKNTINNEYVMLRSGNKDAINQTNEEILNN